jgi:hypothetical protein
MMLTSYAKRLFQLNHKEMKLVFGKGRKNHAKVSIFQAQLILIN